MKNYYEILEVSENASKEIIENSYKILSNKYKVNTFEGDAKTLVKERIRAINEAYSILSDDFLRSQYDNEKQKETYKNFENIKNKNENKNIKPPKEKPQKEEIIRKKSKIGTAGAIGDVIREIFSNVKIKKKKPTKKSVLALLAAIGIVVLVGLILWFIPWTNQFMKSFLLIG